ncbi:MAG: hypothetical protein QOF60_2740 [Actinomycetota bacterium]|jgi:hypothetical protein|nr:hypothetical protein [Actinomycetota bacterium]
MERQLVLIEDGGADYRLDERTREIGRRGVAAARETLRKAKAADEARRDGRSAA